MKTISIKAILFGCVFSASSLFAQTEKKEQTVRDLPELNMTEGVNIHFISPEPIQFVDLSTDELIGDLPSENIARIKITNKQEQDSVKVIKQKRNSFYSGEQIGIITIVGQSFMAQYKATNNQNIEMKPIYQFYHNKVFKKNFRNIYVFKKFTYPNSKVMKIRLLEEQLSGRTIEMVVKYSDILNADTF